jgi:hypothetical protein
MNDKAELVVAAGLGTGGGGLANYLLNIWTQRRKVPVEVDNIIINGAQTTVQSALAVASAEALRADRAEAMVRERDRKIEALEQKIDVLQAALDAVREELNRMKEDHL